MTSNFPTSIDSFTRPNATDSMATVSHADRHDDAFDGIEALETKVGVNSSAVTTSHDYKLSGVTGTDKAVSKTGTETLTNKTLTLPKINEDVALTSTATELNALHGQIGAWTVWTPTTANITVGNGTFACTYQQVGKLVNCRFKFTLGSSSAIGTNPTITLPVTAKNVTYSIYVPICFVDSASTYYFATGLNDTGASILSIYAANAASTYLPTYTTITSTVPFTWTTSDAIFFQCSYEAA